MTDSIEQIEQKLKTKQAELILDVFTEQGWRALSDAQNEQGEGFDFVFTKTLKAGSEPTVLVVGNNQIEEGGCQLSFSEQNNMQLSTPWIAEMLAYLPEQSETKQTLVAASIIETAVAGLDSVTQKFVFIPVEANNTVEDDEE